MEFIELPPDNLPEVEAVIKETPGELASEDFFKRFPDLKAEAEANVEIARKFKQAAEVTTKDYMDKLYPGGSYADAVDDMSFRENLMQTLKRKFDVISNDANDIRRPNNFE